MSTEFEYRALPRYIQIILSVLREGKLELLKELVHETQEKGLPIGWWWEPYASLYSRQHFEGLQYIMDQPNFRFDAPFVNSCCYFTPKKLRTLVFRHPRAKKYIEDPELFEAEASEAYAKKGYKTSAGTDQRLVYGCKEVLARHTRLQTLKATVILACFFTACSRIFIEDYYKPGGKAYLKSKASFETILSS